MKKYLFLGIFVVTCLFSLFNPLAMVEAQVAEDPLGLSYGASAGLQAQDPRFVVGRIISIALSLLGVIAVALIIYAGFKWMTAGGNDDQIEDAKKILVAAVIGLVIILSAYTISNFVLRNVYQATQGVQYGAQ